MEVNDENVVKKIHVNGTLYKKGKQKEAQKTLGKKKRP